CISCGTLTSAQWDAGHYRTTAAAPQLRFDERNIHKQCVVCNQHKSGNLVPYRVELIIRIGQKAVDEIESNHNRHRWTIEECKAIKAELNRPGFPGEYFICELRLPDHYFRWKHNKLFLLLPEEYGPAFP
ncbi:recombination protein NinG, partial [Escherichia coli]|nr:recombination protein NinG [Escherichia coli]